jgi:hypothetical protein
LALIVNAGMLTSIALVTVSAGIADAICAEVMRTVAPA